MKNRPSLKALKKLNKTKSPKSPKKKKRVNFVAKPYTEEQLRELDSPTYRGLDDCDYFDSGDDIPF